MSKAKNLLSDIKDDIVKAWEDSQTEITFTQFIEGIKEILREEAGVGSTASNVSWKSELKDLFTGKGNGWLYFKKDTEMYEHISEIVEEYKNNGEDTSAWEKYTSDAGYVWLRFESVRGTISNPLVRFELRFKDSRKYDKDHMIFLNRSQIDQGEFLGKSPLGLGFTKERKKKNGSLKDATKPVKKQDSRVWQENLEVGSVLNSSRGKIIITGDIRNANKENIG